MQKYLSLAVALVAIQFFGPQSGSAVVVATPTHQSVYVKAVYSLPLTLDPIQMNDTASLVAGNLLYDGLLRFSPTLKLEGALAESWSTSADGRTLTFKLRRSAKFHDDSPITASDVVASLSRALSSKSKVRQLYQSIEAKDGIQARDSQTVVIRLKHPFPPFLSILAGATAKVLPAAKIDMPHFFEHPIGSGPFRFHSREDAPADRLTLDAFDAYYGGRPLLDRLVLQEAPEQRAQELAASGFIHDLANWPLTGSEPIFAKGQRITSPVAATWIIGLNTMHPPFDSKAVRQAFRAAADTEGFRRKFFADALPANGYVPPGLPGYASKTRKSVSQPGHPSKIKIQIVVPDSLARAGKMKAFLESNFRSKGWNVEVVLMPWDQLMAGYDRKEHQAFLVSMNMDYPDAEFLLRSFESGSNMNFSALSDARIDRALTQARSERDRKRRQSLYAETLARVDDAAVTINLFHPQLNTWAAPCVHGLEPNLLSDVYIDYRKVSLSDECRQRTMVAK